MRARVHSLRSDEVKCLCAETKNAAHASCFNNVLTTAAVWTLTLCGLLFIWHQSEEDVGGWHDPWILSSRPGKKKNELWRRHHAFLKSWEIFNVMRSGRLRKISDALRKNCHSHSILCGINFKKDTGAHTQKKKNTMWTTGPKNNSVGSSHSIKSLTSSWMNGKPYQSP